MHSNCIVPKDFSINRPSDFSSIHSEISETLSLSLEYFFRKVCLSSIESISGGGSDSKYRRFLS